MNRRNRTHRSVRRMNRTVTRVALVIGLIVVVALGMSFFFDEMGVRKYLAMQRHARELEADIRLLERTNSDLRLELTRIQHDPLRMEELARERLGFVRKGETVYQLVPNSPHGSLGR